MHTELRQIQRNQQNHRSLEPHAQEQSITFKEIASGIVSQNQANCLQFGYSAEGIRNLTALRSFAPKDTIVEVSYDKILDRSQFVASKLGGYLCWLNQSEDQIPKWEILEEYESSVYIKELVSERSTYYLLPQIYIFQNRNMAPFEQTQREKGQKSNQIWFKQYAKCLSFDFDLMPYRYITTIQPYHENLAKQLTFFCESLHLAYEILRSIIKGQNIRKEYSFFNYLLSKQRNDEYYYQKYCQQFTFDSFEWSFFIWKTRAFDIIANSCESTVYAPILDLFNHSIVQKNADWDFIQSEKKAVVKATKVINITDQIFIDYGERSIQATFQDYGFFVQGQSCLLRFDRSSQKVRQTIEFLLNPDQNKQQFQKSVKDQIYYFTAAYSKSDKQTILSKIVHQAIFMRQIKSNALQKLNLDLQNAKFSHDERKVLIKIKEIIQIQQKTLIQMIKALDLIVL